MQTCCRMDAPLFVISSAQIPNNRTGSSRGQSMRKGGAISEVSQGEAKGSTLSLYKAVSWLARTTGLMSISQDVRHGSDAWNPLAM